MPRSPSLSLTTTEYTRKIERPFLPRIYRVLTRNALLVLVLISVAFFTACIAWVDPARPGRADADALWQPPLRQTVPTYTPRLPPHLDPKNYERGPLRGPPTAHFRGEQKCDQLPLHY